MVHGQNRTDALPSGEMNQGSVGKIHRAVRVLGHESTKMWQVSESCIGKTLSAPERTKAQVFSTLWGFVPVKWNSLR